MIKGKAAMEVLPTETLSLSLLKAEVSIRTKTSKLLKLCAFCVISSMSDSSNIKANEC